MSTTTGGGGGSGRGSSGGADAGRQFGDTCRISVLEYPGVLEDVLHGQALVRAVPKQLSNTKNRTLDQS